MGNITFGNKVKLIERSTFSTCYYLKNVQLPESHTKLGDYAFHYSDFTAITIPSNVQSIGNYAFEYCRSLEQAVIGDKVSSIGRGAFENNYVVFIRFRAVLYIKNTQEIFWIYNYSAVFILLKLEM